MRFRAKRDENQLFNFWIKSENFWVSPQCEFFKWTLVLKAKNLLVKEGLVRPSKTLVSKT